MVVVAAAVVEVIAAAVVVILVVAAVAGSSSNSISSSVAVAEKVLVVWLTHYFNCTDHSSETVDQQWTITCVHITEIQNSYKFTPQWQSLTWTVEVFSATIKNQIFSFVSELN